MFDRLLHPHGPDDAEAARGDGTETPQGVGGAHAAAAPKGGRAGAGDDTVAARTMTDSTQRTEADGAAGARDVEGAGAGRRRGMPRFLLVVLGVAAVLLALRELQEVKSIIAPVFFALNLMITAYPLQRWLQKKGAPAWLGAVAAGVAVLVALLAIVGGLSYGVASMVGELPKYTDQFTSLYDKSINLLTRFGFDQATLVKQLKGISPSSVMGVVTSVLTSTSVVAQLGVVIVTTLIFMVMDSTQIGQRMRALRQRRPHLADALDEFAHGIRKYWLVSTVFGLVVAVVDYGILLALGVPLALVWGMFSFLTNYIPNIGFVVGLVPPALLALVDGSWQKALWVVVCYCVVNFVIQSIIQPRVAGDAVGLTPTLSFLSLLLWGWVFGGLGALIALPLSLLVKALLVDIDPQAKWANSLISSNIPGPEGRDAATPHSM